MGEEQTEFPVWEKKTDRIVVLIEPSLKEKVEQLCRENGISVGVHVRNVLRGSL